MTTRSRIASRIKRAIERRRLTYREVAQRAGVDPRTVERLCDQETFNEQTTDAIGEALGIDPTGWDEEEVVQVVREALARKVGAPVEEVKLHANPRQTDSVCPVVGWKAAARAVGVSLRTLQRRREECGDPERRPWWRSERVCLDWYEAMIGREG